VVNKNHLIIIAGLLWLVVGIMLLNFARVWILAYEGSYTWVFISAGLLLAVIKYFLVFTRMADRNLERINKIESRAPIYYLYTPATYILIIVMMAAGMLARKTNFPRECLGSIDIAIGLGLILGAIRFFVKYMGLRKSEGQ
jgi:integral membrane sensor domain MASE1